MKNTQKDVREAILILAEHVGKKPNYEYLVRDVDLPKLTNMIVYELFLIGFDSRSCSDILYAAYKIIHDYAKELSSEGYVSFEK